MFVDIQALFLDTGIDTQTMCLLNPVEKDETANCRPEVYHQDTKAFCPEKSPAKAGTAFPICFCTDLLLP